MYLEVLLQRVLWICVLLEEASDVSAAKHTVYWNTTNARFRGDNYTVRVEINDYLNIVCPHYSPATPEEQTESFQLYMVDAEGYGHCHVNSKAFKRWECNRPHAPFGPVCFLEKIQLFTPFSLGFEFRPGTDYYYISIPPENRGKCLRLRVSVCCTATLKPTTEASQPEMKERTQQDASKSTVRNSASRLELGAEAYLLGLLCASCLCWLQGLSSV
ncbi:ephrin-A5-like isoform X2 [Carcharodon carcharias]|uniref:ephrin-A5-like isoform X2 n=1 Tax=Carcharodon carcharias TaxID=13397 RepID=UPI001B7E2680|nr:ephrin-A5-like isoform X2 [Carcharodon carcharias]